MTNSILFIIFISLKFIYVCSMKEKDHIGKLDRGKSLLEEISDQMSPFELDFPREAEQIEWLNAQQNIPPNLQQNDQTANLPNFRHPKDPFEHFPQHFLILNPMESETSSSKQFHHLEALQSGNATTSNERIAKKPKLSSFSNQFGPNEIAAPVIIFRKDKNYEAKNSSDFREFVQRTTGQQGSNHRQQNFNPNEQKEQMKNFQQKDKKVPLESSAGISPLNRFASQANEMFQMEQINKEIGEADRRNTQILHQQQNIFMVNKEMNKHKFQEGNLIGNSSQSSAGKGKQISLIPPAISAISKENLQMATGIVARQIYQNPSNKLQISNHHFVGAESPSSRNYSQGPQKIHQNSFGENFPGKNQIWQGNKLILPKESKQQFNINFQSVKKSRAIPLLQQMWEQIAEENRKKHAKQMEAQKQKGDQIQPLSAGGTSFLQGGSVHKNQPMHQQNLLHHRDLTHFAQQIQPQLTQNAHSKLMASAFSTHSKQIHQKMPQNALPSGVAGANVGQSSKAFFDAKAKHNLPLRPSSSSDAEKIKRLPEYLEWIGEKLAELNAENDKFKNELSEIRMDIFIAQMEEDEQENSEEISLRKKEMELVEKQEKLAKRIHELKAEQTNIAEFIREKGMENTKGKGKTS